MVYKEMKNKRSQSIFSNTLINNNQTNFNYLPNQNLTFDQTKILNDINFNYTTHIATREYPQISSDINEYFYLLNGIKRFNLVDPTNDNFQLLIKICKEGLQGSLNLFALYQTLVFDQLQYSELEIKLAEILSDKNNIDGMNNTNGKFSFGKQFRLAPIYNDYITIFGLPTYGVGFDSLKLDFLQNLKSYF
jgi:hypothetical protein